MSQPVFTALLALALVTVLTAAIAIATSTRERAIRAIKLSAIGAVIGVVALEHANLRINFTASMPIGIYSLSRLPFNGVKRGMLVAACAPAQAAEKDWQRGYFARGPCVEGSELLLKSVAAIGGDLVDVTGSGVLVNGHLLPDSRPLSRDRSGRRLRPWRRRYRLVSGQVWLYAANEWSWDSRYWGPAAVTDLAAEAVPLLVLPRRFRP